MILVLILCAVLFFGYRRYKKVLKAKDNLQKIVHSRDIEEARTRIVTKKEFNRNGDKDQTIDSEGENSNINISKSSCHRVEEEKMTDFRHGLDKVSSEL